MSPENSCSHRAAVVVRDNNSFDFHLATLPLPEPSPTEVLVKLSVSGVCGSDFGLAAGAHGPTKDILGHEGIGRVVKLGTAVSPSEVSIGQRVGVAWQRDVCGKCAFCLVDGGETRCAEHVTSGRAVDGTFAEYTIVPLRYLMPIPEGPSDAQLAPILCGGVTAYKALKVSGAVAGQWIVISGAGGGVGALGIQYAKAMGLRVIAVDAGEEKRTFCMASGADAYVDVFVHEGVLTAVMKATENRGASAVLVCTGSRQAYQDALSMLSPFGTLVCIGIPPPTGTVNFHPLTFIEKGIRIIGSAVGTRGDILEAIGFVERGIVKPSIILISPEGLSEATKQYKQGKMIGKYVIRYHDDQERSTAAVALA